MSKNQHIVDGNWAEQIAIDFLTTISYKVLQKNWRHKRAEVDIICEVKGKLVFVEVKYRRSAFYGDPEEAVSELKIRKLQEAAEGYFEQNPQYDEVIFDIISITGPKENAKLKHFKDAFFPSST